MVRDVQWFLVAQKEKFKLDEVFCSVVDARKDIFKKVTQHTLDLAIGDFKFTSSCC